MSATSTSSSFLLFYKNHFQPVQFSICYIRICVLATKIAIKHINCAESI